MRGLSMSLLFLAVFGTIWAFLGMNGMNGWGTPLLLFITLAICITLLFAGISLLQASRKVNNDRNSTNQQRRRHIRKRFRIIFAIEVFAVLVTMVICKEIHHSELLPILIAMIVGIHFFPLGALFQIRLYYLTGLLFCLLVVSVWLFVPVNMAMNGHQIVATQTVTGFGSGLLLWGTALMIWLIGNSKLK